MRFTTDDRLAIHDLLALHGHLVDAGALDRLGELFSDDVVYDLTPLGGTVLEGVEEIAASARELGENNPVAHLVTNIVVEERGGEVTARSKFLGVRRDGSVGSGVYDDVVRRTSRGWRIARRRVSVGRQPLPPCGSAPAFRASPSLEFARSLTPSCERGCERAVARWARASSGSSRSW
jgi:3-phenylpropionate/cinnamic acid dioxygenase small subunit